MDRDTFRRLVLQQAEKNVERYAQARKAGASVWLQGETGQTLPVEQTPPGLGQQPWLLVKAGLDLRGLVRAPLSAMQMIPNDFNKHIGGSTPLATLLAGGLLGAGTGYLGGRLVEALAPAGTLEKGRARSTLALLGGLAGTAPGLWMGSLGVRNPDPSWSTPWQAWTSPNPIFGKESEELAKEAARAIEPFVPDIPVDSFGRVIWTDNMTPLPVRAAVSGLLDAASESRGGVQYISPADIGRIAVGAGAGYLSASLVGKTLGALAGLTPQSQNSLQRAGLWSGVLLNTVPLLFR